MGGRGSGRPPSTETLIKRSQPEQTPIADSIFIPNLSGVQDAALKTAGPISAGGGISSESDPVFMTLSGTLVPYTGATATVDLGAQDLTTTGDITGTNIYGDGSNLTNVGAAAASALTLSGRAAENIAMGQPVYISGSTGSNTDFSLADNNVHGKGDVIGLAAQTKTTGQTILIRAAGELLNWDTTGQNGETWSDGDKLYLSGSGYLTNLPVITGAHIHVADVASAHAVTGDVAIHIKRTKNITTGGATNIYCRMGDNAGANKLLFRDSDNVQVGYIDSDGNLELSGTATATNITTNTSNIATISGTLTTHAALTNEHLDWTADLGATNINAANYTNTTYSASDFNHNDLSGLNDGTSYEHITQTQKNALHTQNTDTALGSGAVAADHGTAATDQVVNVCYGTGDPPTANTTTIGSLFVKYTA